MFQLAGKVFSRNPIQDASELNIGLGTLFDSDNWQPEDTAPFAYHHLQMFQPRVVQGTGANDCAGRKTSQ